MNIDLTFQDVCSDIYMRPVSSRAKFRLGKARFIEEHRLAEFLSALPGDYLIDLIDKKVVA